MRSVRLRKELLVQTITVWLDPVPQRGVTSQRCSPASPVLPGWSGRHGGQPDDGIIAQWSDCFQRHVASSLHRPFVVLFQQDSAHEAEDGGFVGKDSHHICTPLDLAIEASCRVQWLSLLDAPRSTRLNPTKWDNFLIPSFICPSGWDPVPAYHAATNAKQPFDPSPPMA